MDVRFLERWLLEDHETTFECPSCRGVFGPLRFSIGVILTTYFDTEESETAIKAEPFAQMHDHPCHLTQIELGKIAEKAQAWATSVYRDAFQVSA